MMMAVKLFELWMAGAVVVLLAVVVMMMLITELLGNSPWEEVGEGKGGEVSSGMERSLTLLAALLDPGRRAQPVGRTVGMLGWTGEAMAQLLRKVGSVPGPVAGPSVRFRHSRRCCAGYWCGTQWRTYAGGPEQRASLPLPWPLSGGISQPWLVVTGKRGTSTAWV